MEDKLIIDVARIMFETKYPKLTWDKIPISSKWMYIEMAYKILLAIEKERKK